MSTYTTQLRFICESKSGFTVEELENNLIKSTELKENMQAYANFYCDTIFATMQELRAIGDAMETETATSYWPYPSYSEMLFSV